MVSIIILGVIGLSFVIAWKDSNHWFKLYLYESNRNFDLFVKYDKKHHQDFVKFINDLDDTNMAHKKQRRELEEEIMVLRQKLYAYENPPKTKKKKAK
jgi:cell shape-determining protein MreC